MKIANFIILFIYYNLNAQAPIIDRYSTNCSLGEIENAYIKDVNNYRNQFVGTWLYSNGPETLRVRFKKVDMFYNNGPIRDYEDYLVGEIQYVNSSGVEKFNTLNVLNQPTLVSIYNYSMYSGSKISNKFFPQCLSCPIGTNRLYMHYSEPGVDDVGLSGAWAMRVVTENGVLKLKVQFAMADGPVGINKNNWDLDSTVKEHQVPYGEYTLIKEN